MKWKVSYLKSAAKEIRKLDAFAQRQIKQFLEEELLNLDHPRVKGKSLESNLKGLWRYRLGDYRVICEIQDEELLVLVVRAGHRKNIYR